MLTDSSNQRWTGVLNAAAAAGGWVAKMLGSNLQDGNIVTGRASLTATTAAPTRR